jgi:hypothetical protein
MFIELKTLKGSRLINPDLFSTIYYEHSSNENELIVFFQFIDKKQVTIFSYATVEDFEKFRRELINYYDRITQK